ncbi:MAG: CoA transferase, partial [Chloroflexi bacterium]|nr:CoA transferase [Chloroflexota bacterium]
VTGFNDRPPALVGAGVGDSGTGMHTVIGILAALVQRNVTGKGQMVEVAMQEAVLNLTRVRFTGTLTDGTPEPRQDDEFAGRPGTVSGLFACLEGGPNGYVYMMLPPDNAGMFKAAMEVMGRQELIEDPRFTTEQGRHDNAGEIMEVVRSWAKSKPKREVMAAFASRGVPCGAVFDTSEVLDQPHLRERGMIVDIEHPTRGTFPMIGCPVRLSDSPVELKPAPLYGEHSDEVFTTLGGLTQEQVDELRRDKVIL